MKSVDKIRIEVDELDIHVARQYRIGTERIHPAQCPENPAHNKGDKKCEYIYPDFVF